MAFQPPAASAQQLAGIAFDKAVDFATAAKKRFDDADHKPGNQDPSKCKALLRFAESDTGKGAVFWSSKMAIDADGPAGGPGRRKGTELDPSDGQNDTTFHFANGQGLPSELVPYIVLPQLAPHASQTFDPLVAIGDVALVIFKDKATAAICGDIGPFNKIGEASIRVHEALQQPGCPDPCAQRGPNGFCQRVRNASVEQDVLFFVFPGSAFDKGELTLDNVNDKLKERAFALFAKLRSPGSGAGA